MLASATARAGLRNIAGTSVCRRPATVRFAAVASMQNRAYSINKEGRFPTVREAKDMPRTWHEYENSTLLQFCGPDGTA